MKCLRASRTLLAVVAMLACALPLYAQQTGSIQGKVTDTGGGVLPGVTVEARSPVLPGPRVTTTAGDGTYQLPALPPGEYTITFTLSGMQTGTQKVLVQLSEVTHADAVLAVAGVSETVQVTASSPMIDRTSAEISSGIPSEQIRNLPVGQEYRDLIKLLPGVQYTQDQVRGPSAGSSGQDNVYKFDGVNVTLPLFGTLSAEPASHDIAEVNVVKGGAKAVDFDRAGGFAVDSVSKTGTSKYSGQASYQFQKHNMSNGLKESTTRARYQQDRDWTDLNLGGPVVKDHVFFYGSYYRPTISRQNASTAYGPVPDYNSTRNEGFGKVTVTPTHSTLLNLSYRNSHRLDKGDTFGQFTAPTAGSGNEARLKIGTADGSWIINGASYVNFKYTHFANLTQGRPDNVADATASTAIGTRLDIANLDKLGGFTVPTTVAGADAYNAFVAPIISKYGFLSNGVPTGGGFVGYATLFDKDDFFRDAGQIGYNLSLSAWGMRHNIHAGYQRYTDSEDLTRSSNGWGSITAPGGRTTFPTSGGQPIYYLASFQQQGVGVPTIHSEYRSQSIEANDTINWKNWTYNVGVLASNDTLYGQGLQNAPGTLSGFVIATGTTSASRQYKMYEIPFSKLIQPRLSATWAYNGKDTVFGSFARYNPAASSLPRAASWDRNLATTIEAYFDQSGVLFGVSPLASSSGKLFVPNMTPPTHNEWIIGTARQFTSNLSGRAYFRYNKGTHYWEDTNNDARLLYNPPDVLPGTDAHIPKALYIPDLNAMRAQIGQSAGLASSGSSYVIAELDGAFTDYRELTVETEYRTSKSFIRGSYTRSRYYGNFDQDNSASNTSLNDGNIFIGSSNIGDGPGRQLWDNKLGTLRGDRPNAFKIYGSYFLPWNASAGAFFVAQSGQPWETWNYEPYRSLTTNTSETIRYAEPAGSHRSPSHSQMDVNYTQNVTFGKRYTAQAAVDVFNITNSQTGYNIETRAHASGYGLPRNFYDPRRAQIAVRFMF